MSARELTTEHLDLWTGAVTHKSSAGRGRNGKIELTGIKKLRELILELAVRGKLVEQDPNDEPASVLLERIAEEKARLVKEGKIKKPKKLPEITVDDLPAQLPKGWTAITLSHLGVFYGGKTPSKSKSEFWNGDIPWVTPKDMKLTEISGTENHVTEAALASGGLELLPKEAVLFVVRSGILRRTFPTAITRTQCTVNQDLKALQLFTPGMARYIQILSWGFEKFILLNLTKTGTTVESLKFSDFASQAFPLPPLDEQHRIVDKVDELMALCDRLEQQAGDQLEAHEVLVDTLLYALTRSADASEVAENWVRIAEHFDTLFTTEASIDKLKQTILQLAVMGRLVEQGPNDEPASVLLERIAEEKARLAKEGKIKKPKSLPEVDAKDLGQTPNGWRSVRFGELMLIRSELVKALDYPELDQVAPDSIEKGTGRLLYRRTVKESGAKGPNNKFHRGQILYSKIRPSLSKAVIAEFDGLCSADMYPINSLINSRYLLLVILSEPFLSQVRTAENRIKMPKLNIESLSNIVVGLPPEAEQYRIVEKLDELMALCDQLKARLGEASETRTHLAEAVVEQAVS